MAVARQSVLILSGDGGGMVFTPIDIRTANHVTLVGATTLTTFGTPTTPPTETVMVVPSSAGTLSSGGGYFGTGCTQMATDPTCAPISPIPGQPSIPNIVFLGTGIPEYQTGYFISSANSASPNWRNSPDVSMFGAFEELVFTNSSGTEGQITKQDLVGRDPSGC